MSKRFPKGLFLMIGLITAGSLLSGCEKPSVAGPPPQAPPPEVAVVQVEAQRVPLTTELSGRISAQRVAEVRPQVGGIIQKRLFTEGAKVTEGEVLYQIDPARYQAAFNSAKAALGKAEASLIPARLKEERFRELVEINAVSKQDFDDISAGLKQAESEVEVAKAAVETARINLAFTRVTAPISGWIGRSLVTTGALVTASQTTPLASIQQLDPIYVDVTQTSSNLLRLKREMGSGILKNNGGEQAQVQLILEDGYAYPLKGTLKFSDVTVEPSTGSVILRTAFPNPRQMLLPGMFARAILQEGVLEQAILVPQQGVTRDPAGKALVMVVGAEEKVEPRVVQVARAIGDNWLISDGLKPGDRVILEGTQRARPGTVVKTVPFGSQAAAPHPAKAQ